MKIKIGNKGYIQAGDEKGYYVLIKDDSVNTGGYLIITNQSPDLNSGVGYDNWVKNSEALEGYFNESNWIIEWLE